MSTKYDGYAPAPTRQYSRSYSAPSTTSAGEDRTDPISVRLEQAPAYELVNEVRIVIYDGGLEEYHEISYFRRGVTN